MKPTSSPRSLRLSGLGISVAAGVALGLAYAGLDMVLDREMTAGGLVGWLAIGHEMLDHVLPVVTGALLGLAVHGLRLRAEIARAEARRAELATARLQRVERDQAVWIVVASALHELRNPLHALGLLLDDLAALEPHDVAERAALLDRARTQMEKADAELAALKSLPALGRPELGPVAIDEVVESLAKDVAPLARREGIELSVQTSSGVHAVADPGYVRIIVSNLVDNSVDALRHKGECGHLAIEVDRRGDKLVVRVRDDGPGVPDDVLAALFEPLSTTKSRGLGLGLSIARALARSMRGDVGVESRPGATTFWLELPSAEAA